MAADADLGRSGDDKLVERFTRALAAELRAVGISLDFTPVLDILTNPKNPAIGDRALAEAADEVGRIGSVIIRTLQAEGIAASASTSPATATPASTRITICQSLNIRPTASSAWSSFRSGPRSTPMWRRS